MLKIDIFYAVAFNLIWGLSFPLIQSIVTIVPPFFIMATKLLTIFLFCLPFAKASFKEIYDKFHQFMLIAFINGLYNTFCYLALAEKIDIVTNIMIGQSSVLFTMLISHLMSKTLPSTKTLSGILLSFISMCIVIGHPQSSSAFYPIVLSCLSSVSLTIFTLYVATHDGLDSMTQVCFSSMITSCTFFIYSYYFEYYDIIKVPFTLVLVLKIATLCVLGVYSFILWFKLLNKYKAREVVPFSLIVPAVGFVYTIVFSQQMPGIVKTLAVIGNITGLAIVYAKKKAPKENISD